MNARVAVVGTQPETAVADSARLLRLLWPEDGLATAGVDLLLAGRDRRPGRAVSPWLLSGALAALAERLPSGQSPRPILHWRGGEGPGLAPAAAAVLARSGLAVADPPARPRAAATPAGPRPRLLGLVPLSLPAPAGMEGACAALARATGEAGADDLDEALLRLEEGYGRAAWLLDLAVTAPAPGGGPWWPTLHGVLLAGTDPVAVDRAAADLLGLDERMLPQLESLRRSGHRPASRRELEWVGDDPARFRRDRREVELGPRRGWPWHRLVERRAMSLYRRCPWGQLEAALSEGPVH